MRYQFFQCPTIYFRFVFRPSENRKCCKTIVYNTKRNKCCGNNVLLKSDETCEIRSWFIFYDSSLRLTAVNLGSKVLWQGFKQSLVLIIESYCNLSHIGLEQINSLALIFFDFSNLYGSSWIFMNLQEFSWNFILFFLFTMVDSNVKIVVRVGFWRFGVR